MASLAGTSRAFRPITTPSSTAGLYMSCVSLVHVWHRRRRSRPRHQPPTLVVDIYSLWQLDRSAVRKIRCGRLEEEERFFRERIAHLCGSARWPLSASHSAKRPKLSRRGRTFHMLGVVAPDGDAFLARLEEVVRHCEEMVGLAW